MYSVKNHWLYLNGKRVTHRPSPNHGGVITPRIIVIHYTGDNSLSGALSWLCSPKAGVSAHLVIGKDGTVYQLLPFNLRGWHAGVSSYDGESGVNNFSIGIENVGRGDAWPASQVEANRAIIEALFAAYGLEDVVGHEDVATPPGRKADPGPRYPWDRVAT
ncbi:MAG: N-acetylmuramoyl-L-alanine amidase [Deltaproteobacteria bacterium]|nr:N-acetylmuramoyl-L-alanine amidase [Deltaproteobacteria bacterium]